MNPGACHIYLFTFKHVYFLRRNPPHYQQHPPLSPLPSPPLPKHPESPPPLYPESLPEYPTPPKFELLELDVQVVVDVAFKDQYERLFFSVVFGPFSGFLSAPFSALWLESYPIYHRSRWNCCEFPNVICSGRDGRCVGPRWVVYSAFFCRRQWKCGSVCKP